MSFVKKTALVNLRMPPSLKAAAQKAAAEDRRSLTSLIEKLLVDYLRTASCPERDGLPPRDAEPSVPPRFQPGRLHDPRGGPVVVGRSSAQGSAERNPGHRSYG